MPRVIPPMDGNPDDIDRGSCTREIYSKQCDPSGMTSEALCRCQVFRSILPFDQSSGVAGGFWCDESEVSAKKSGARYNGMVNHSGKHQMVMKYMDSM